MSLRRRITAAAALAVAAVAVTLGVVAYVSTRSHLIGQLQTELRQRANPYLQPHSNRGDGDRDNPRTTGGGAAAGGGGAGAANGGRGLGPGGGAAPSGPAFGGAPGYFQSVYPDGTVIAEQAGTQLPVNARVLAVARRAHGSFFETVTVDGQQLEVLTAGDPFDKKAVEVALPLGSVTSVLHGLLITYALLIGIGVAVAGLLGTLIARAALAPINRFSEQTEQVISALEAPRHLEETGGVELARLAGSFNRTLDALERSVVAQRHLIADASHELRTPLAALRSNIQIFLDADRLPESERRELQEAIVAELDELTQLVSDVLELARGSASGEHTEPVELDSLVREAVARAQRRAPSMTFALDLEATVIINSPERVARAVSNLIDNARKWSPPDGTVEIDLHDGMLTVRDHGPGFRPADLEYVFDRFYRAEDARRMTGSGLGLAIVKQAAEAHGGHAQASNAPGGGALLRVSFGPTVRAEHRAALPAAT